MSVSLKGLSYICSRCGKTCGEVMLIQDTITHEKFMELGTECCCSQEWFKFIKPFVKKKDGKTYMFGDEGKFRKLIKEFLNIKKRRFIFR